MRYLLIFLTSLFISTLFQSFLIEYAVAFGFVDIPEPRKLHTIAIPRIGGIGMVIGTGLALILWIHLSHDTEIFLLGIGCLSIFGILDDRYNLHYLKKLFGQFVAVSIVVSYGNVLIKNISIFGLYSIPDVFAYPMTVIFLLGTTNAMNLSDGLDGLAAGLSLLSIAFIAYLAMLADGKIILAICAAIAGSTFGFLRYNTHPAEAFMGDTGSQFLGFSIGILAVSVTNEINTALSSILPLFIIGFPVTDTLRVIVERILRKVSPFQAELNHFHHKLLAIGFGHYESVLLIYIIQVIFIYLAYLLRYQSDILNILTYVILLVLICCVFPIANYFKWRWRNFPIKKQTASAINKNWVIIQLSAENIVYIILSCLLSVFTLFGVALNPVPEFDIGLLTGAILCVWILSIILKSRYLDFIQRISMYCCVTLSVYGIGTIEVIRPDIAQYFDYIIALIAVFIVFCITLSRIQFSITPSDYLVMFMLIAYISLPSYESINYATLTTEAAIALYSLEYSLKNKRIGLVIIITGCMLALLVATAQSCISIS